MTQSARIQSMYHLVLELVMLVLGLPSRYLSVCLSIFLYISISVHLSIYLSTHNTNHQSVCKFPSIQTSIYLSIYLFHYSLYILLSLSIHLFLTIFPTLSLHVTPLFLTSSFSSFPPLAPHPPFTFSNYCIYTLRIFVPFQVFYRKLI